MAAEAMFRKGLPSSVMSKIDKVTEREEKIRRKKAGTDVPVISAKMYHKTANMQTKQYFTESRLSKLIKNMAKDREFYNVIEPSSRHQISECCREETKLEESKKKRLKDAEFKKNAKDKKRQKSVRKR